MLKFLLTELFKKLKELDEDIKNFMNPHDHCTKNNKNY